MWRMGLPMIFVCTYETAIVLLSQSNFIAKSQDINFLWKLPGAKGLSSSPAELHHTRRKLLCPGYTRQIVEHSMHIFDEESRRLLSKLDFVGSERSLEIMEFLMPCSFRIICRSALGKMEERTDEEALKHMVALHKMSKNFTNRMMSPFLWLRNDWIYYNWTKEGRETKYFLKFVNAFGLEAIQRKRMERKPEVDKEECPCYMDMLLDLYDTSNLKEEDLLGELNNYIVAGYDTTALTVGWCLFALALNPQHQDVIYQEVKQIFDGDKVLSCADTKKMRYLELCIKEALRLFPTSPVLPRSTTDNMKLMDGRVVPSGTDVFIMVDMIHRDERHFPEPEKFIPQRHLKPNPSFIPWGIGARSCIGQVYAMHQIKVEMAYLIREFVWETEEDPNTMPRLFQALMVPAEGIRMKITRRK